MAIVWQVMAIGRWVPCPGCHDAHLPSNIRFRCEAAGCFPVLVGKHKSASEDAFFSQLLAYLESGFPLFVAMPGKKHAVVIVGYSWRQSATPPNPSSSHVWPQVETLLAVDDNLLPYSTVPLVSPTTATGSPSYTAKSFEAFIVALPDKIYYPADAVERFSKRVEGWLAGMRAPDAEPLQLRRYFITTVSRLREYARDNHTHLGDTLLGLIMHLETAQFVWVVEYCSVAQWSAGLVAARAIVDATASPRDPVPIWLLHDERVAQVFDRTSAERKCARTFLRTGAAATSSLAVLLVLPFTSRRQVRSSIPPRRLQQFNL